MISIADLLASSSTNDDHSLDDFFVPRPSSRLHTTAAQSRMAVQNLLHEGFDWDTPRLHQTTSSTSSPSSSAPSSPSYYSECSSPSSPGLSCTTTTTPTKTSLSFILNDTEDTFGIAPSSPSAVSCDAVAIAAKRKRATPAVETSTKRTKVSTATTTSLSTAGVASYSAVALLTESQRATLEAKFELDPLPDAGAKLRLSQELGVPLKSVQQWFQNHRSKLRKREKKRVARAEAARRAALTKPRFIFHNMKAKAQENGFLQQFVVDTH